FGGKIVLVAVVRDFDAANQFHDEVRAADGEALTPSPSPIGWASVTARGLTRLAHPLPLGGGEGRGEGALGDARIINLRDVRMVHERQRLALSLEASDDL